MRYLHVALATPVLVIGIATARSDEGPDRILASVETAVSKPPAPAPAPFRVVVISDLNSSYGSTTYQPTVHEAVQRIVEVRPDLVLVSGDMVAGQRRGLDYRGMWRAFHHAVSDPLAEADIPLAVAPGNHDASSYPGFDLERATFEQEWLARKPAVQYVDDSHYPFYYSFVAGDALFIALDVTRVGPIQDDQLEWLEQQLIRGHHDGPTIVYGHLPLHPFAQRREHQYIRDDRLEALLVDHDVTMFVSGHHHTYYPGRRGKLRTVGVGCLGAGARRLIGEGRRSQKSFLMFEIADGEVRNVDGYAGDGFTAAIDRETLPARIVFGSSVVIRDDLWRPEPEPTLDQVAVRSSTRESDDYFGAMRSAPSSRMTSPLR